MSASRRSTSTMSWPASAPFGSRTGKLHLLSKALLAAAAMAVTAVDRILRSQDSSMRVARSTFSCRRSSAAGSSAWWSFAAKSRHDCNGRLDAFVGGVFSVVELRSAVPCDRMVDRSASWSAARRPRHESLRRRLDRAHRPVADRSPATCRAPIRSTPNRRRFRPCRRRRWCRRVTSFFSARSLRQSKRLPEV